MIKKICKKCGLEYPATTEYFFKNGGGKNGLRSKCKTCFQAANRLLKSSPSYREKAREYSRKYYVANKERLAERWQRYYQENLEYNRQRVRDYAKNNLDKGRAKDAKRREDPHYRLHSNMSRSIRQSLFRFDGKGGAPWEELVGYTKQELVTHLESQFIDGMSWANYGEWHIDHVIPQSAFNFSSPEHIDFKRCWALDNLQPLWSKDNLSKNNRLEKPFQPALQI